MVPIMDMVAVPSTIDPMKGYIGWIVTDGRDASLAASASIAAALGLNVEHKRIAPRAPWSMLPSWSGLKPPSQSANGTLSPPWPDIAIAVGGRTAPYLQALRRVSEGATFTVLLQPPRLRYDVDLIWSPAQSRPPAPNVISTLTTPHAMRPRALRALKKAPVPEIDSLSRPLAILLLGGPTRAYRFDPIDLRRLGRCLRNLADSGVSFLIIPSQRTTGSLFRAVNDATRGARRILWTQRGSGSYWTGLAKADLIVVTADSASMTSEACATGAPVYVFEPEGDSEELKRFHAGMRAYGATRPLTPLTDPAETWSYRPLDSAPLIAAEIVRRFHAARQPNARMGIPCTALWRSA